MTNKKDNMLTIGLPKGSLQESTLSLFAKAGFSFFGSERSLWLLSSDAELQPVLLRPQEIPSYVADGSLDCGVSGLDWITETDCEDQIRVLADLCYSKRTFRPVRWVLAVADDSPYETIDDLKNADPPVRISTELLKTTENWLAEKGIIADVSFSWGATEAKVPVFADAIVECVETGSSLRENRLRPIETIFESTTQFFANKLIYRDDAWKRAKLDGVALLLESCLKADSKVKIHVQVSGSDLPAIKALIPSDASFSVWKGENEERLIEIIIQKASVKQVVPALARNGAKKVSVQPLMMVYE
jgi:ATP phosphoribosyltransferase